MKYEYQTVYGRNVGSIIFEAEEVINKKKYDYTYNFLKVIEGPTGNCQLSSLCFAKTLLFLENIDPFLKLWNIHLRKQLLLDIEAAILERILNLFGDNISIVNQSVYENYTGTTMVLLIIKRKDEQDRQDIS